VNDDEEIARWKLFHAGEQPMTPVGLTILTDFWFLPWPENPNAAWGFDIVQWCSRNACDVLATKQFETRTAFLVRRREDPRRVLRGPAP
jgi:hypothetical protein